MHIEFKSVENSADVDATDCFELVLVIESFGCVLSNADETRSL